MKELCILIRHISEHSCTIDTFKVSSNWISKNTNIITNNISKLPENELVGILSDMGMQSNTRTVYRGIGKTRVLSEKEEDASYSLINPYLEDFVKLNTGTIKDFKCNNGKFESFFYALEYVQMHLSHFCQYYFWTPATRKIEINL